MHSALRRKIHEKEVKINYFHPAASDCSNALITSLVVLGNLPVGLTGVI